jgi:hypothetical protein
MSISRIIRRPWAATVLISAAALATTLSVKGCSAPTYQGIQGGQVGQPFPAVVGQSLEEERIEIPAAYAGDPVVILIGYKQRAQFDIDRWVMGLMQADVAAPIVELPTIPGLAATFASGWIDDGMRAGIPREDWAAVVTLYGDAATPVAKFTGNDRGHLTRVAVLDAEGRVLWFDDEGYSARKALEVADLVAEIRGENDG